MPGFGILETLLGGMGNIFLREREMRSDLYTQAQLEILQTQEEEYRNNNFNREYESLSMSSWQSSRSSSSVTRSKPKRHKRKIKVVKPKEFFKKEEFDI